MGLDKIDYLMCIGRDGQERRFVLYENKENIRTNEFHYLIQQHETFNMETDSFTLIVELMVDGTLKVVSINKNDDDLYGAKGIPEILLPKVSKIQKKNITSSRTRVGNRGEFRSLDADKMWERLEEKGIARYNKENGLYFITYQEELANKSDKINIKKRRIFMTVEENQKYYLNLLKVEFDKQNYKTKIVLDHKPCIQIAVPGTFNQNSKSKNIPTLHYEFIFNELDNPDLDLDLEIHCEKTKVRDEFYGNKIKNIVDPYEDEYEWVPGINGKKIIRDKNKIDLQVTNDEKIKSLTSDYLKRIRDKFETELIDLFNRNKSYFG